MSSEQQHRKPSISLDNYEEFFLLYIDHELSESERKDVESFLEKHPALQEELDQLLLTICEPETLPGIDKRALLKNHVDADNVESLQLLLIDHELDVTLVPVLEEYMNAHPASQKNLQLLQQTKLPLEQISFPNKEKLLKNNHNRTIIFRRISYSIAASLVLFLGLRIFVTEKSPSVTAGVMEVARLSEDSKNESISGKNSNVILIENAKKTITLEKSKLSVRIKNPGKAVHISRYQETQKIISPTEDASIEQSTPETETATAPRTNNLPVREITVTTSSEYIAASNLDKAILPDYPIKDNYASEALINVSYANYREPDEENEEEKKGLKNIIRKANRIYNKVTHPEPDKTLFRFAKKDIGIPR